jgi:DNA-binding GntR family transcriptional regulator
MPDDTPALIRPTAAVAVADSLRARILAGSLAEGAALRQEALAAELGVSRIPLREAFRLLAAEGLITLLPHRGAVVSALSADEIAELFDLRALIESDLIRRAVPRLTEADLDRAEATLAAYADAFDRRDVEAWGRFNTEFHLALHKPAGRPRSLALAQSLLDQTDRYTRMQLLLTQGQSRARREHEDLLNLCRKGEAEAAGTALARHIQQAGQGLTEFLEKRKS